MGLLWGGVEYCNIGTLASDFSEPGDSIICRDFEAYLFWTF